MRAAHAAVRDVDSEIPVMVDSMLAFMREPLDGSSRLCDVMASCLACTASNVVAHLMALSFTVAGLVIAISASERVSS